MDRADDCVDSTVVCCVVENRSREICIIRMNSKCLSDLDVYTMCDSHSYSETISTLQMLGPAELLLHDGRKGSVLSKKIEIQFGNAVVNTRVIYISRQHFDQDRGAEMLKHVCIGYVDKDLLSKYTVLAGAFCLLRYMENIQSISFPKNSVRLLYRSSSTNKMSIDRNTASQLELVSNLSDGNQKESLFGALNRTKTRVGARFLRAQILRPAADLATINTRHAIVSMLLEEPSLLQQCTKLLTQFPELDVMLNGLSQVPKNVTTKTARVSIDTLIMLKLTIRLAEELSRVLETAAVFRKDPSTGPQNPLSAQHELQQQQEEQRTRILISAILNTLKDDGLKTINDTIQETLVESTSFSKSSLEMRHQECFAIQPGVSGLLDVSRKTFLQSVEDIYANAESLSKATGKTIKVQVSQSRGYYLQVMHDVDDADGSILPEEFIQQVSLKKSISCSTAEITSLSDRAIEAITNALRLTHDLLQDVMGTVREQGESLYSLVDAIALLDMLGSFAQTAGTGNQASPFVRPSLTNENAPLLIQGGRHPVVSTLAQLQRASSGGGGFVCNDTSITPSHNFLCIMGPNGSGKTVYIKQIALIVIMAQIGSFVPCRRACIPIRDRLLSRMGSADDMENNLSSFLTEMKENAYILSNLTPRSLVIIDELGRGTSNIDGMVIAFAIAEKLIESLSYTAFVTHYPQLAMLGTMYSNVRNLHLDTALDVTGAQGADNLRMLHRVKEGALPPEVSYGYGIMTASQVGFPPEIIAHARGIQVIVREEFPNLLQTQQCDQSVAAVMQMIQHLTILKTSSLDDASLRVYLTSLRGRVDDTSAAAMLRFIRQLESSSVGSHSNVPSHPSAASETAAHQGGSEKDADVTAAEELELDMPVSSPLGQTLQENSATKKRRPSPDRSSEVQNAAAAPLTPKPMDAMSRQVQQTKVLRLRLLD